MSFTIFKDVALVIIANKDFIFRVIHRSAKHTVGNAMVDTVSMKKAT